AEQVSRPGPEDSAMPCRAGVLLAALALATPLPATPPRPPPAAADRGGADGGGRGGRAGLPPLIPRSALFSDPARAAPQVSPDGKHLAYLAPDKGVLQVWVQTVSKADARPVTRDDKRGIRTFRWAYAANTLLYLQDHDGENRHLHAVNLE